MKTTDRIRDAFARYAAERGPQHGKDTMEQNVQNEMSAAEEEQMSADAGASAGADPAGLEAAADESNELEQLRGERDALKDRLARLQAEFDNARKRDEKMRGEAVDRGVERAVEPFLSVMDNFQLALKADGSAEQLRAGVELILKQMEEALRGLRVEVVETVGAEFDPRVHEALGSIETAEFPDHSVVEEIRKGYKLRDKLLRPALVRIAVNPSQVSE